MKWWNEMKKWNEKIKIKKWNNEIKKEIKSNICIIFLIILFYFLYNIIINNIKIKLLFHYIF